MILSFYCLDASAFPEYRLRPIPGTTFEIPESVSPLERDSFVQSKFEELIEREPEIPQVTAISENSRFIVAAEMVVASRVNPIRQLHWLYKSLDYQLACRIS
jgi:hypothetical protein